MRQIKKLAVVAMCATLALPGTMPFQAKAADVAASDIKIEGKNAEVLSLKLKGEKTPSFKYGVSKNLELTLNNSGEEEIQNITITPRVTAGIKNWPFEIEKVSYEKKVDSIKGKESADVVFSVVPRQNVETKYYKLIFDVSYGDKTFEQSMFVKMEGKTEDKTPDKNTDKDTDKNAGNNQNQNISGGNGVVYPSGDIGAEAVSYTEGGGSVTNSEGTGTNSGYTPRVIVTGFTTEPAEVKAGSNFKLIVHLKNTSKSTAVENMLFDFSAPSEGDENTTAPAFLPSSGSSAVYLEKIKASGTKDISIDLNAKADLLQKPYSIELSMKYEDGAGGQYESAANISVPVKQDARFEISEFEMSSETVEVGSETNIMCNLYNLGRVKLYNVKAKFEGEGLKSKELFLGNVESGATAAIDGMVTGEQVTTGDGKAKLILTYEDEAGTVSTSEKELTLLVTEPVPEDVVADDPSMMEEETKGFPIIPVVIGVVIVAAIVIVVIIKKRKKKKALKEEEEFLEDELDRLTEDE